MGICMRGCIIRYFPRARARATTAGGGCGRSSGPGRRSRSARAPTSDQRHCSSHTFGLEPCDGLLLLYMNVSPAVLAKVCAECPASASA